MKVSLRTGFGIILVIFVLIHTNSSIDLPDEQSDPVCDALLEFCSTCKSVRKSCRGLNKECRGSHSTSPKDAMAEATKEAAGTMTGVSYLRKAMKATEKCPCELRAFCTKCKDKDIVDACKQAVDC